MTHASADIVRRVAFARYVFTLARGQSDLASPLCCVALLMLHDAIELFIQTVAEHLGVGRRQPDFVQYWDLISGALPGDEQLGHKEPMRRLNKARVAMKHNGVLPSERDVQGFVVATEQFFEDSALLLFDRSFSSISLLEFVEPETARTRLENAQKWIDDGNAKYATDQAAMAFALTMHDYEIRKKAGILDRSPFFFGEDMMWFSSFSMGLSDDHGKLGDFVDKVKESLESMQEAMKILALGIDYRKYSRFRMLTPPVEIDGAGEASIWSSPLRPEIKASLEDARFCVEFVIEAAVRLQEFDYTVTANGAGA